MQRFEMLRAGLIGVAPGRLLQGEFVRARLDDGAAQALRQLPATLPLEIRDAARQTAVLQQRLDALRQRSCLPGECRLPHRLGGSSEHEAQGGMAAAGKGLVTRRLNLDELVLERRDLEDEVRQKGLAAGRSPSCSVTYAFSLP